MGFGPILFFGLFITIAIVVRLVAGMFDEDRIRAYIKRNGGRLVSKEWAPFGTGWFGSQNERIYDIQYVDKEGNRRKATAKTSLFAGVYLTSDRITKVNPNTAKDAESDSVLDLQQENARLKKEIEELRGNKSQD